ncbi:hypothetical protein JCM3770_004145 [Rhodotorula araucariae]
MAAVLVRPLRLLASPGARIRPLSTAPGPAPVASRVHAGLWYHAHPAIPGAYTLSYLESPAPSLAFSPTTIGTLRPAPSPPSHTPADPGLPPITPRTLTENPDWLRLVHDILRDHVHHDPWLQAQASALHDDTHLHIADDRAPADANRVPAPQDILASVLVHQGRIVPASYEPNRVAYRVVTEDGLMRLPPALLDRVREACLKVREVEQEVARGQQQQ